MLSYICSLPKINLLEVVNKYLPIQTQKIYLSWKKNENTVVKYLTQIERIRNIGVIVVGLYLVIKEMTITINQGDIRKILLMKNQLN